MKIIVGKTAGFCYGVERAVQGAIHELAETKDSVCCLGEIVHNQQVIKRLEDLGINCIETLEEAKGIVLIRAHGVPKEIYDLAKKMNIQIQDYTCPNVLKVHKIAEKYRKEGYFIFLLGTKNHPENVGTLSHCGEDCFIFEKKEEIENAWKKFEASEKKKLVLISQTTFSLEKFYEIEKIIKKKVKSNIIFEVKNTICRTTELRQKETEELSKKVDTMIIIGGKNSSNTRKLYEIARNNCNNSILIETAQELNVKTIGAKVGIMAGASTPKENIKEVIEFLKEGSW